MTFYCWFPSVCFILGLRNRKGIPVGQVGGVRQAFCSLSGLVSNRLSVSAEPPNPRRLRGEQVLWEMEFVLCQTHMLSPLDTSVCFVGSSLLGAHLEPDCHLHPGLIPGWLFGSFI